MSSRAALATIAPEDAREGVAANRLLWIAAPVLLALVVGRFLAEPIRRVVLIQTPRAVPTANVEAPGATAAGDSFFVQRDSVTVLVSRDIPVGQFLDLNHMRNTRGIREELRRQAGVAEDQQILKAGKSLRLHLTVPAR
ncbi:MAG: hypothetical protein ACJ8GN_15930 [Longimicrobiaceae bacterium]